MLARSHMGTHVAVYEHKGTPCIRSKKLVLNSASNMINCCTAYIHFMKRTHQAIFLALMMATMSLAGCFGGDDKGSDEDENPVETLEEWQVHFAN